MNLFSHEEICYCVGMPRPKRICPSGEVFHVLNRAAARLTFFEKPEHLLAVMRYVERNPLRAGLVDKAEAWRWSSAWAKQRPKDERSLRVAPRAPLLPRQWRANVNKPQIEAELASIRKCIKRGSPFGDEAWTKSSVARPGLERTQRPRG